MPQTSPRAGGTVDILDVQVGNGRTPHYATGDSGQRDTLCDRPVSRLLTAEQAARMRSRCTRCAKAAARLAAEAPTDAPTGTAAPAESTTATVALPAPPITVDQAVKAVAVRWPDTHAFQPHRDTAGAFLGYTFEAAGASPDGTPRYGYVTGTGTYVKSLERDRPGAAALLPAAVLDDKRVQMRRAADTKPARRVVEGVVVEHAGTAEGSAPKHAGHPDVVAARAALTRVLPATLTDHAELDGSEPATRGYMVEPRGAGEVRVFWIEDGRVVRRDEGVHGASLDCLAWSMEQAGWNVLPLRPSATCVTAHAPVTPADVVRTDGVVVLPDDVGGLDTWTVELGDDFLGVIRDEGPEMSRGRFCIWASHDGIARFFHSAVDAVDAVVKAWPTTAANIAAETGATVAAVLAAAEAVDTANRTTGRRAVLRIAACTGADTRITKEAAVEVAERLASPARCATGTDEPTPTHSPGPDATVDTTSPAPAGPPTPGVLPEWRTLKGVAVPFQIYGQEHEHRFGFAGDRKRVTGEPLTITRLWFEHGGYSAEDGNGRAINLHGAAAKYWVIPGPTC